MTAEEAPATYDGVIDKFVSEMPPDDEIEGLETQPESDDAPAEADPVVNEPETPEGVEQRAHEAARDIIGGLSEIDGEEISFDDVWALAEEEFFPIRNRELGFDDPQLAGRLAIEDARAKLVRQTAARREREDRDRKRDEARRKRSYDEIIADATAGLKSKWLP